MVAAPALPQTFPLTFVDAAVAAGSYTYEVRVGSQASTTVTLRSGISATPAINLSQKGVCQLLVWAGAHV